MLRRPAAEYVYVTVSIPRRGNQRFRELTGL
jgi:hypothetical protein